MKCYITLFSTFILLFGCQNEKKESPISPNDNENKLQIENKPEPIVSFDYSDLHETIYEHGGFEALTDSCTFYYECDCCSGTYYFNADSTFYYTSICVADESWTIGYYKIDSNKLILTYSGLWANNEYNWENEMDSTAVDYFKRDTIIESQTGKYFPRKCKDKLTFRTDSELLLKSDANYKKEIQKVIKSDYIERLKKLLEKQNQNNSN